MKLSTLKQYTKLGLVVLVFVLYSVGLFGIGKVSSKLGNKLDPQEDTKEERNSLKKPLPSENIQSASVQASNVKLCASTEYSFEVVYPSEWFTTYNDRKQECLFFAPYSFVTPAVPEDYFTPITVKVIPKDEWDATVTAFKNPNDLFSIITFKNSEVNGRPTKLIEATSTGNSVAKGFLKITYLVFDADTPLELTLLQESQEDDLENYRKVLGEMVQSLRYF